MHMTEEQKAPFLQLLVDYGLVKKDQCILETHGKEAEAQTAWNKGKALEEKLACMLEDLDIVGEEETALFDELDQKKAQLQKAAAPALSQEDYMQLCHCVRTEIEYWEKLKAGFIKDHDEEFEARCAAHAEVNKKLLAKLQEVENAAFWNKAQK